MTCLHSLSNEWQPHPLSALSFYEHILYRGNPIKLETPWFAS